MSSFMVSTKIPNEPIFNYFCDLCEKGKKQRLLTKPSHDTLLSQRLHITMKIISVTSLLVVVASSILSNVAASTTEQSNDVSALLKNLRHLGTGGKQVKGEAKKDKKVKGDAVEKKEKMPPKVKGETDKKKEKAVKGESSGKEESEGGAKGGSEGGAAKTPSTKAPKSEKPEKTKSPKKMLESDYPSIVPSVVPAAVPV